MCFLRSAIIARRTGLLQVGCSILAAAVALLPMGFSAGAAPAAVRVPIRADTPETDWNSLDELVRLICFLLNCVPARTTGTTALTTDSMTIQDIQSQVVEYLSAGLRPDLTPEERAQGAADTAAVQEFLEAHPGMLPSDLHVDYYVTLEAMRHDLRQ